MPKIDLKALTPDTTVPATAVLFGADTQTAATPSVYPIANIVAQAAAGVGASTLDVTKSYVANDIVFQSGHIYRANGAVPAGAFDATKWTEIGAATTATLLTETSYTVAPAGGFLSINCAKGNVIEVNLTANVSNIIFSGVPAAGTAVGLTIAVKIHGSFTINWGSKVHWAKAKAPTLTTTGGKVDIFTLVTWDGGTTWYGVVAGQEM